MISRARLLQVGVLALLVGAALLFWRSTSSAVLYSGYARADDENRLIGLDVRGLRCEQITREHRRDGE